MTFEEHALPGVWIITPTVYPDSRGWFSETYREETFREHGIETRFVQDNHSHSIRGVLRGLHYQKPPKAQGKLVSVIQGEIFDVAVDIRKGSPTYGQWVGEVLSSDTHRLLYVPAGFAHGFCVLSEEADVVYKVTNEYAPDLDRGIIWNDPDLAVQWPIEEPLLSPKDAQLPCLRDADVDFVVG